MAAAGGERRIDPVEIGLTHGMALAASVHDIADLPAALEGLGLNEPRPTLVVVGGAEGLPDGQREQLRRLFERALVPAVAEVGGAVVDGGTDSGVMSLMGQAVAACRRPLPLIGVAAIGTVAVREFQAAKGKAALEPNHSHFFLVPGEHWGDESEWLSHVAAALAGPRPSATVLLNGGEIAWQDVEASVACGRPVIVFGGSGRTADELASPRGVRAGLLVASGLVSAVSMDDGTESLSEAVRALLEPA